MQTLLDYLRPDPKRPGSLYVQLARALKQAMHEGMLEEGEYLPPQRDLAVALGVSRVTVRKAIETLVEQGLLMQRQGAGTRVLKPQQEAIHKNLSVLNSFTEDMAARGLPSRSEWLSRERIQSSPREAIALNLSPGSMLTRYARVRYAGDNPMAYEVASVPGHIIQSVDEVGASLYAALEAHDARPVRALQTMTARNADQQVADYLSMTPGEAVLYIERQGFDQHNRPVEFTRSYYRGDIYDFVTELKMDTRDVQ
ncbi:GntR family transcriptional regulator [Natronospirillum operosum]|uniref:GntR family transcriptional regulator n=2 Tax=Natronospirillum operosum TaxID=2759953 RepID=A0A4Z0W8C8_9GAMM|nr:GntR family transcriptional regulator [Natronospirillum operosum]